MTGIPTHEQKQLAIRLSARGWRLIDIAREIGCSAPTLGLIVPLGILCPVKYVLRPPIH